MNNNLDILNSPYIDNGAYKVPKGYFDTLDSRIMSNITYKSSNVRQDKTKATPNKSKTITIKPWYKYLVAACLTGIVATTGWLSFKTTTESKTVTSLAETQQDNLSDQYISDCMTYAMIDNDDIYMYLSEN